MLQSSLQNQVEPDDPPFDLQALREKVLRMTLFVLGFAVPFISLIFIIQTYYRTGLDAVTVYRALVTLFFPALAMGHKFIPFKAAAAILLGLLVGVALLVSTRGGVSAGSMMVSALALFLGSLFFGRRGAIVVYMATVAVFIFVGVMITSGNIVTTQTVYWDSTSQEFWIRQIIVFVVLGLALVLTQLYVNEKLVQSALDFKRLAEREKAQRLALEAAEKAREDEHAMRLAAQRALEQSHRTEALSRMAGGIAHDFNNTLTVMLGNAELARMYLENNPEGLACVDKIMSTGESAIKMTRELLTIGRKGKNSPQMTGLEESLQKITGSLQRLLPATFVLDIHIAGDPFIYVDPVMFERAFYNLLLNARDAMPKGGRITVASDGITTASGHVLLTVADEGMGMDEDTIKQVFDPFFSTKGDKGTGLGLSVLQAWITSAGGEITVTSTPGRGTVFTLKLPVGAVAGNFS